MFCCLSSLEGKVDLKGKFSELEGKVEQQSAPSYQTTATFKIFGFILEAGADAPDLL